MSDSSDSEIEGFPDASVDDVEVYLNCNKISSTGHSDEFEKTPVSKTCILSTKNGEHALKIRTNNTMRDQLNSISQCSA